MKTINKEEVSLLLRMLINTAERPLTKEGDLDVNAFNKLEKVESVKGHLKEMGVDGNWLGKNGFIIAEMILEI